jgi:thiamine transporter ThiT
MAGNTAATRLSFAKGVRPQQGKEEALMSLTMTIVMLVSGWLAVAAAMLWGVLRVTRRHHHPVQSVPKTDKPPVHQAPVH